MREPGGADLSEGQGEAGGHALLLSPAVRVTPAPALHQLEEKRISRWGGAGRDLGVCGSVFSPERGCCLGGPAGASGSPKAWSCRLTDSGMRMRINN